MKKSLLLRGSITIPFIAVSLLHATNGDTLIGVGAKTRSMGGAGIALGHGAESTLVNPALITSTKSNQISFGGTIFMPTIKTDIGPSGKYEESDADISMIPAVAISSHLNNGIYLGIGMYGTAGMGTDFRDSKNPYFQKMETTLQLMQFVAPVAYKLNGLSVAVAPIIQYGSLDINMNGKGNGQRQDFGFGFTLGAIYDFGNGFSVGAVYKSKIKMKYKNEISAIAPGFGDHLDQPAEIGIGIGYHNGPHSIALDFKKIKWGSAAGYKDFGWKDQNVIAVGYQYDAGKWSARVGFNHATSPIKIYPGTTQMGGMLNYFNILGFPATSENHFTAGATYNVNKNFSVDVAVVYSPSKKTVASIGNAKIINRHKEFSTTIQFNYKF